MYVFIVSMCGESFKMYTYANTNQMLYFVYVQFITYKLYLSKNR